MATDDDWHGLEAWFTTRGPFIYGTHDNALVYIYDGSTETLSIELAVIEGSIAGHN